MSIFSGHMSLKERVYLVNAILLCITLTGAVLMVWYTYKIEAIFKNVISRNVVIFQSAEALSISLVNQKGFVSYYLLDNNPDWIVQLKTYRNRFNEHLVMVKSLITDSWETDKIAEIESKYRQYTSERDKVISFYASGDQKNGVALHQQVRQSFFDILELCEEFKGFHKDKIQDAIEISRNQANRLRYIALLGVISVIMLSLLVNFIFARHILEPIRKLALQADIKGGIGNSINEVDALKRSVMGLIENAEQTHIELKRSQESLMQSEKMALVGKLAAGTAHSIRNPLTSVKMRLFSLNRTCAFTESQREDFNVISTEIMQIKRIVENFLEFARPPKLVVRRMSPSTVVDSAVTLLGQRLKSYQVIVKIVRSSPLAETLIDPEQLKEVIVNIMINACEAMYKGGLIMIYEEERYVEPLKKVDVIRITDNGSGIPESIRERIFDPFFTTRENGTGLGLSIAFNIINEHGGWLDLTSEEGTGSSFVITLPVSG
ncbi:Integral membrane sensor signal transduction histidine kinase [Desulfamplus magnetovallimortis]|uniref:histidine kinase n=1 Tax=Desulfamplus magnetovallimortis TaxID=1246637 RepID=A0A1W1HJB8_9BACT|nr:ATP-binding protein [Desulfamplus magnetovallimortis]SLM32536.1 Integral membrane sensor signal transduction histidine kinase [Desulfamplus magnetovallimortis]